MKATLLWCAAIIFAGCVISYYVNYAWWHS